MGPTSGHLGRIEVEYKAALPPRLRRLPRAPWDLVALSQVDDAYLIPFAFSSPASYSCRVFP